MHDEDDPNGVSEAVVPLRAEYCPRVIELHAERPRDKLLHRGAPALTNAELLAVIAVEGRKPDQTVQLFHRLLRHHKLENLVGLTVRQFRKDAGLRCARACRLAAAFELCRRIRRSDDEEPPVISGPREAYRQVPELRRARKEHLVALFLDAQNRLLAKETVSVGSLNTTRTHPREILQPAIAHTAMGFILIHNHPSGSLAASQEDVDFTRAIKRSAEIVGIGFYDHLIVSERGYVSLKEKGLL